MGRFAHACSYDRAGLGWSDAGPMPRSSRQIVEELRALLLNAGVEGPFVLVGHSFGTFTVRLFASTYPSDEMTEAGARKLAGAIRFSRYGALLARLAVARLVSALFKLMPFTNQFVVSSRWPAVLMANEP